MTRREVIPIASDHAGFELKERLAKRLAELGYEVRDLGTNSPTSSDYPDYAHPLARKHNDANVLVLPARFLSEEQGEEILKTWLETPFEGGRHERRVSKIEREPEEG